MPKIYVPTPEAELFLRLAATKLAEHKASKGSFPTKWSDLDITYVNGPYYLHDPDIRPPAEAGASWRPKKSNYEFRLTTNAARDGFRIDAVGPSGRAEYFIEFGPGLSDQGRSGGSWPRSRAVGGFRHALFDAKRSGQPRRGDLCHHNST